MIGTDAQSITIRGEWLHIEPLTPQLESTLLNSGMAPSDVADLKVQGAMYCQSGEFFVPPLADFTSTCGTACQCRHKNKAVMTHSQCQICWAWIYLRGFISAIQLDDNGTYKAVHFCQDNT